MTQQNRIGKFLLGTGIAALVAGSVNAGDYGKAIIDDKAPIEQWTFCDLFDKKYFYQSETGLVRSARFLGRYHGQHISQQEDVNDTLNNGFHHWQHRRFRLGFEVEFANDLTFYIESNLNSSSSRGTRFTDGYWITDHQDLYLEWAPSDDFALRVGKQKQHITLEDIESSKRIKTVERSPIVNEMAGARPYGAVVEFATGEFDHQIGAWLYGGHLAEPSWVDTNSNAGFSYNIFFPINEAVTGHFDYVYADNDGGLTGSEGTAATGFGPNYEHALAAGVEVEAGRFQLMSDIIYAANRTASGLIPAGDDTWGFYVIPSYDITDKLEAVFKYAYMDSGQEQRTARFDVRQRVENYHTIYAGLQYFICGENLKLMGGYEYSTGDIFGTANEVDTGSWQVAVRTYW